MMNVHTVTTSLIMEIIRCFKTENVAMFIPYNLMINTDMSEVSFIHCHRTFGPCPEGFVQALMKTTVQSVF